MKSQLMFIWARIVLFVSKPLGWASEYLDNYAIRLTVRGVCHNKPANRWMPGSDREWPKDDFDAYRESLGDIPPPPKVRKSRRKVAR